MTENAGMKEPWPWRKRLRCWWSGHVWISDLPVSLIGKYAILASLWMPPATCKCCGKRYDGINSRYAEKEKWLAEESNECTRCRINPY
jgi:hypothetical protein